VPSESIYCIDTSGLLIPFKERYRYQVFTGLWGRIEELIKEGRLVAPEEVYRELQAQEDDLSRWARDHKLMLKRPDAYQIQLVTRIGERFPNLYTRPKVANTADPWVVALAQAYGHNLVTGERGGSEKNPKIPYICDHYKVKPFEFIDIVYREGWVFPN
jgi:hypothetical protein